MIDWNLMFVASSFVGSAIGIVSWLVWWLSKQFSSIKSLVYSKGEETKAIILSKLEYHERHDDERFASVVKDLWEIRIRNASIDGNKLSQRIDANNIKDIGN